MAEERAQRRLAAILAADVVGYSRLMERDEEGTHDRVRSVLREIVGPAIDRHHGRLVKTTGDGFLAEFASLIDALRCAVAMQRETSGLNGGLSEEDCLRFRMGINLGDILIEDGDVFGDGVNVAARLEGLADAGGIMVSHTVHDHVQGKLPFRFDDLGERVVKNIARPIRVFRVGWEAEPTDRRPPPAPGLRGQLEMPRAGPVPTQRGNIPAELTPMMGRDRALAQLLGLISSSRAVTVIGMGGIGKTRLALEAARRSASVLVDGAWFIDLGPVQDEHLVLGTIAMTLNIAMVDGATSVDTVGAELREKQILIVLDNCEHVIASAARVTEALLQLAPKIRILATSREPLGFSGEKLLRLLPLDCPQPGETNSAAIGSMGAVQLFAQRLQSADPTFAFDDSAIPTIAEICRRLDGIPLALEMAASQASAVGLDGLASALRSRLRLRMPGKRTALPRHRTLQAMLDWSGDLLEVPERSLLRRLAVFPGAISIAGAHAVCAETGAEEWETVERIGALVQKSLVAADNTAGRFRLLETVRAYALEKLEAANEEALLRRRHAQWTLQSLEEGLDAWGRTPEASWLERYGAGLDDCRGALRWTNLKQERDLYVRLASASYRLWLQVGIPAEGLSHAEAGLRELPKSAPPRLEIQMRIAVAELAAEAAMHALALETILPALSLCRALGDRRSLTAALIRAGFALTCQERHDQALLHYREAAEAMEGLDEPKLLAWATTAIGMNRCMLGDVDAGIRMCETALEMHRSAGDDRGHRKSLLFLAECAFWCGNGEAAIAYGESLIGLLRGTGGQRSLGHALCNLAAYLLMQNRQEQARRCLDECHGTMSREIGTWPWCMIQNYALLAAEAGNADLAARLLGYVDCRFRSSADVRQQTERIVHDRLVDLLRQRLAENTLASLLAEGAAWGQRQADEAAVG